MLDPIDLAYARLSSALRLRIVAKYIPVDSAPERLVDISMGNAERSLLSDALEIVYALGDEGALEFVEDSLKNLGWSASRFKASAGRHDRAAELWLLDEAQARLIARWWNANGLIRSEDRSDGFETPDFEPEIVLTATNQDALEALVASTLRDHLTDPDIVDFRISHRPSPWPEADPGNLIQIDIKRGSGPQRVEIEEGGLCVWASLNFVSTIVVVLDPGRRTIHVCSDNKKRELRADLARTVIQHFYGRSDFPAELPPLGVHPDKLKVRPSFGLEAGGQIASVRVSELWYRRAPSFRHKVAVIAEPADVDLYSALELESEPFGIEPYRARIEFKFRTAKRGEPPVRRVATLLEPNSASFPRFTPAQRYAAEKFLVDQQLIDPNYKRAIQNSLAILDTMEGSASALRLERSLGPRWCHALKAIGALVQGTPSDDAFCPSCLSQHPLEAPWRGSPPKTTVRCPIEGEVTVDGSAVETLALQPGILARWAAEKLEAESPSPGGWRGYMWELGTIESSAAGPRLQVCLALGLGRESRLADLSQRLGQSPSPPGIVLTFSDKFVGTRLASGWLVGLFAGVTNLAGTSMEISKTSIQRAFTGRKSSGDGRATEEDWNAVVEIYASIRGETLRHYTAAKKLRSMSGVARKWGERQLADKLKRLFPEDFQ